MNWATVVFLSLWRMVACSVLGAAVGFFGDAPKSPPKEPAKAPPAPAKPDAEKKAVFSSAELARLEAFFGAWSLTETHYSPSGQVVATVKGTEEITWILDDRALQRNYTSNPESGVYRAQGTLTWNSAEKVYQGVWFDNVNTFGLSAVQGAWQEETRTMTYTMDSTAADGSKTSYKIVERFEDDENRTATTYRMDGTSLVKVLEVRYKRAAPCPGRIMIIDERR